METKNEALELAKKLEYFRCEGYVKDAADMLRSQASEIERLTNERDQARKTQQILLDELNAGYQEIKSEQRLSFRTERDQLKAKNEKLVVALNHIAWRRPPGETSKAVELLETLAIKALKENT